MRYSFTLAAVIPAIFLTTFLIAGFTAPAAAVEPVDAAGIDRLVAEAGPETRVTLHPTTGAARFVRLAPGSLVPLAGPATATARAAAFFQEHGGIFGLRRPEEELRLISRVTDDAGFTHLSFRQEYFGVPVFAAVLRFHQGPQGDTRAVNGVFLPGLDLDVRPARTPAQAAEVAVATVAAQLAAPASLAVAANDLYVYRTGLDRGVPGRDHLVYRVEVTGGPAVREFVFVDAHSGKVVDQITGVYDAMNRRAFDSEANYPANPFWEEGDPFPTGNTEADHVISVTEDTYNLYFNAFGFDSWDGAGAVMDGVFNRTASCPNASWNGTNTSFCPGVSGDDTVAHEWTHAYTDGTHNLIYRWQPGALNESYSDIFGEVVDFLNAQGTDIPNTARAVGACTAGPPGASVRWLSGEDDPAFGGAIRDLWTPTCFNDPGKVSDAQYSCGTGDNGGVHSNSGVPNHGFALLVDGGTYNGQAVAAIGLTKATHVYWRAMSVYQTPSSDFTDHADALEQSCADLLGVPLTQLSTESGWIFADGFESGDTGGWDLSIQAADCAAVAAAMLAVEARTPPSQCNFQPLLDPNAPALCGGRADQFFDDFESDPSATWTLTNEGVFAEYTPRDWEWRSSLPSRAGSAFFALDSIDLGDCNPGSDDQSGVMHLDGPVINTGAGLGTLFLAFDHWVATESSWDGGNVKISVNGGPWTLVAGSDFTFNAYNGSLNTAGQGNTNPLAGEEAFHGSDGGSVEGSWGQSQVNLSAYASPGDTVRLRFDLGVDGCNGLIGWYVDDVRVYRCP